MSQVPVDSLGPFRSAQGYRSCCSTLFCPDSWAPKLLLFLSVFLYGTITSCSCRFTLKWFIEPRMSGRRRCLLGPWRVPRSRVRCRGGCHFFEISICTLKSLTDVSFSFSTRRSQRRALLSCQSHGRKNVAATSAVLERSCIRRSICRFAHLVQLSKIHPRAATCCNFHNSDCNAVLN